MICPACQHQMISGKPGYMCLNCGHLVAKKGLKTAGKAASKPKAKPLHQTAGVNKPLTKSDPSKRPTGPKPKAAKAMDIKVRIKAK
jgi:hypothetical protein